MEIRYIHGAGFFIGNEYYLSQSIISLRFTELKAYYPAHNIPPLLYILRLIKPVHPLPPYFFNICFNIIPSPSYGPSKCHISQVPVPKLFRYLSPIHPHGSMNKLAKWQCSHWTYTEFVFSCDIAFLGHCKKQVLTAYISVAFRIFICPTLPDLRCRPLKTGPLCSLETSKCKCPVTQHDIPDERLTTEGCLIPHESIRKQITKCKEVNW
jgi:hypothetical protein